MLLRKRIRGGSPSNAEDKNRAPPDLAAASPRKSQNYPINAKQFSNNSKREIFLTTH